MAILWTDSGSARRLTLSMILAGAAAGVLGPQLAVVATPILAPVTLALALVLAGWFAASGRAPSPARLAIAACGGLLAALVEGQLPPGPAHVVLGVALGVALAPTSLRRLRDALLHSLPTAAGVLVAGVLGGVLLRLAPFVALTSASQGACLGALLGLGAALGELTRYVFVARAEPPAWIEDILERCGAATRPLLLAAVDAHRRVVGSVLGSERLGAADRHETLNVASDLLAATARAVQSCDEAERATLGLGDHAGSLEGHAELLKARTRIRESLQEKARRSRSEAGDHAAALARLAATLTSAAPSRTSAAPVSGEELEDERMSARAGEVSA